MSEYITTIGLEIHAELNTQSKMFCGCRNAPDNALPNTLVCPVCMAHPGTLPTINQEAVRQVLRVGVAVGGQLADFSEFDRKNYFYPDIPKGYQISQYKYPLVSGGAIGDVAITRIHLEEDTARSTHATSTSSVDFNRAGVPLMELVTEPVIHDAQTAISFARDLMLCLRYLGASNANLEKGEMRIEANISIAPKGEALGTKVEVKNLNSFKAVEQAIAYEVKRHTEALRQGKTIDQETRGWDENRQKTFSQRSKENAHDYRYFPEPDLPKLYLRELPEFDRTELQASLPVLPWDLRVEYQNRGMYAHTVETLLLNTALNSFYHAVYDLLPADRDKELALNYITTDLLGLLALPDYVHVRISDLSAKEFAELMSLISSNVVSSRGAKEVLAAWVLEGGDPKVIAEKLKVVQVSSADEISSIVATVVKDNQAVVDEYRAGKEQALQYLVGQGMKISKGSANPSMLKDALLSLIGTTK